MASKRSLGLTTHPRRDGELFSGSRNRRRHDL